MIGNIGQALEIRKAQTVTGHAVTALCVKTDFFSGERTLSGWSWEPEPNLHGCLGPCRWNMDGTVRGMESRTELTDWVGV
jgi:hypothetical protein